MKNQPLSAMKPRCKVVMLPTTSISQVILTSSKDLLYFVKNNKSKYVNYHNQHLYILSDEEIKEGDWYYNYDYNYIKQCLEMDKELIKNALFYELGSTVFDYSKDCKKIIASTDKSLGLLEIEQDFIKEYCEKGGIDEVMVDFDNICKDEIQKKVCYNCKEDCNLVPKISPNNTITITPVKDSWDREEYETGLRKAFQAGENYGSLPFSSNKNVLDQDAWIKENL